MRVRWGSFQDRVEAHQPLRLQQTMQEALCNWPTLMLKLI